MHRIVVVMGNGTSIVFNDRLMSATLAGLVANRLPNKVRNRLTEAAEHAKADGAASTPETNFEDLLGPLDRMAMALGPIASVVETVDAVTAEALHKAEAVVRDLYLMGVGTALGVVAEESAAHHGPALDRYAKFVKWTLGIAPISEDAELRFFNLNYDPLLDSQLFEHAGNFGFEISDQADGRPGKRTRITPIPGKPGLVALPLRDPSQPEYLSGRRTVIAYHLHGSLQWLRDPTTGQLWKAAHLEELRDELDFFDAVRQRKASMEPVVVLTDRKSAEVGREPFSTAYRLLEQNLLTADTVVIAGYGLRDVPLNAAVSRGLAARAGNLPAIAVIGQGSDAKLRARAARALAPPGPLRAALDSHLTTRPEGLPGALGALAEWP